MTDPSSNEPVFSKEPAASASKDNPSSKTAPRGAASATAHKERRTGHDDRRRSDAERRNEDRAADEDEPRRNPDIEDRRNRPRHQN